MSRRLAALAPLLLLAGCGAFPTAAGFDARMAALVGRSEVDLVQALGVPTRSTEAGGFRFLEYERQRVTAQPIFAGRRFGSAFPADYFVETRDCRVTFTLRAGRVERYDARGNDCFATPPPPA